ncbi:unannotated protein [freshwater metagenome]|uniref:Unannotated protein n=1 Tax=freshwater metagenome TaxID=449393 RepID=A0A6J7GSL4_9ZZZZ|nr:hypothetical protein [Actinomycetota bacterium]
MRVGPTPRHPRPTGRPVAALLLAGAVALGLGACGGGSDDDEATVAPDAAAAAGTTTTTSASPASAGDERARAGAVVTQYVAAFSAGDGDAVCRLHTAAGRRRLAKAGGGTCAGAIRTAYAAGGGEEGFKRSLGNLRVGTATVKGRQAVVRLVAPQGGGGTTTPLKLELERSGDAWRISRPGGAG